MIASIDADAAQALAAGGLLQLVDGTWLMPGSQAEHGALRGTTATVDTDAIKALPHDTRASRSIEVFANSNVKAALPIAVYDRAGFFSAPWVAWLMASHGATVSVVRGEGEHGEPSTVNGAPLSSLADPSAMNAMRADVLAALGTDTQIIDGRGPGRFAGTEPEPREGCKSGHIPGSINLHYRDVRDGAGYRDFEDVGAIVKGKGIDLSKPIITTCGSGVTASLLAVILQRLGACDVRVYQGSWAEWGMDAALPVETGP